MTVVDLLRLVPATFWGVIAGSFFTLIGITLTNRHDRVMRDRQRQMDLRKEVYLAAAEAIAARMLALGRMANLGKQLEASNDFEKVAPAIAKVYVIGRIETINAALSHPWSDGLVP